MLLAVTNYMALVKERFGSWSASSHSGGGKPKINPPGDAFESSASAVSCQRSSILKAGALAKFSVPQFSSAYCF